MPPKKRKVLHVKPGVARTYLQENFGSFPSATDKIKNGHILHVYTSSGEHSLAESGRKLRSMIAIHFGSAYEQCYKADMKRIISNILDRYRRLGDPKELSKFIEACEKPFPIRPILAKLGSGYSRDGSVPGPSTDANDPETHSPQPGSVDDRHENSTPTTAPSCSPDVFTTRKMLQPCPQESNVTELRSQLENARKEILALKRKLKEKDSLGNFSGKKDALPNECQLEKQVDDSVPWGKKSKLDNASIERYSRQLILPEIGVQGQLRLCNSSALIVGAGGLGCPAAIYLAAAGIGRLGIVDYDDVELGNLHRQILHTQDRIGHSKSTSISASVEKLNSSVRCEPYQIQLDSSNAMEIIEKYDIVLDCTDNVATRYLLNDACVLAVKPLVSGSALRFEGQLTVYNHEGGPCYRCLYPKPPPPETVTNCSSGGVLGVVPGIIGCFQALEALKIAIGMPASFSQKLLLLDALDGGLRTIKLRPRQPGCAVCGKQPSITKLIDYEEFCGASATDKCVSLHILPPSDRITVSDLSSILQEDTTGHSSVLLDVRPAVEFEICRLPHFINIPIDGVSNAESLQLIRDAIARKPQTQDRTQVLVICRRGNDSQLAVKTLQEKLDSVPAVIKDIQGGLTAWTSDINPDFPKY